MIFKRFSKTNHSSSSNKKQVDNSILEVHKPSALEYSWILTSKLAIGPIPRATEHWNQLESDGFTSRFSCCYPKEHTYPLIPKTWNSLEVSLPDHRSQEPLTVERLSSALEQAIHLMNQSEGALYLHCFAGQERSVLIAVGIVSVVKNIDLFDSLTFVRQCHKKSKPLYSHLELLDQVLKNR